MLIFFFNNCDRSCDIVSSTRVECGCGDAKDRGSCAW